MRDLGRDDAQLDAVIAIIAKTNPDVLVLTEIDFDFDQIALAALQSRLQDASAIYDHRFTAIPNAGQMTPFDLDQNGHLDQAEDAQGYGRFLGDGGMAVLSRWPISLTADATDLLWTDLPGATPPEGWPDEILAVQRLSSANHWVLTINHPEGAFDVLAFAATPPVFDGPEDRNGLRNRDELRLISHLIDTQAQQPFVVAGKSNLDPVDGDGLSDAMAQFLADPRIQDPKPRSRGGATAPSEDQFGDPALDTADWPEDGPGNLRVSYVLPSTDWTVLDAGVFWPAPDDPDAALLGSDGFAAGPHRLVWVDISR